MDTRQVHDIVFEHVDEADLSRIPLVVIGPGSFAATHGDA